MVIAREEKWIEDMLRTRLLWFTVGFSVAGAAITKLVWQDLWSDRYAIFTDTKQKFDTLEARVSNLESDSNLHKVDS